MVWLNFTYAMLNKQEIIIMRYEKLLEALFSLQNKGSETFKIDPSMEDLYFNIENYIISSNGGKLHTARSRNDINATVSRMNTRDAILTVYPKILKFRKILLNLASDHIETVLTGYTHMQPAQPITFAHYLTAIAEAVERDYKRLVEAYERLNYCPLGGVAFAGTSFNIDRYYTAKILGFYSPVENSLDAISSRDYLLEITSHFTTLGSTINRFAQDLYIWTTDEFSFLEVDDSFAMCSSIMPQKKNPITLEHIKGKTSHLLSAYVSIFSCAKGISYGHCRDLSGEGFHLFWDACYQMEAIIELLSETIRTMKIKIDNMKSRVNRNYSTVTDLADELVRKEDISFRLAHQIVGYIVGNCISAGLTAEDITIEMLNKAGQIFVNKNFNWSQKNIDISLNASNSIKNKISTGSPSPNECEKMIKTLHARLDKDSENYKVLLNQLEQAREELLNKEIDKITKNQTIYID